jgi:two-component system phosphate regulon response regulator PhoB
VDDEPDLLELVRLSLHEDGFCVDTATTGQAALERLSQASPDLIVLDLMLPDVSGMEICRHVRATPEHARIPIIMLTAKASEIDKIVGFEVGEDDYVTKPFSPRELVLRVRAVLRRPTQGLHSSALVEFGSLRLDVSRRRCSVDEHVVELTAREFDLLYTLMKSPGMVLTRDQLIEEVWGRDVVVTPRTIDTHIKKVREKLGDGGRYIETVRSVGYRFAD